MKVLQIIPSFGLAGAERMAESLILGLAERGVDVSAASFYDYKSAITNNLESHGIRICYLNKKPGYDVRLTFKLRNLFKNEMPNIVHTHLSCMKYSMPAGDGLKQCYVHTVHSMASVEVPKYQQHLHKLFFKYCDVVPVAISPIVRQSIEELYDLSEDQVPMIYNGVTRSLPNVRHRHNKFTFLHIGRYMDVKNHRLLIESFAKVHKENPNTRLVLLGDGELFEDIKSYIAYLDLSKSVEQMGSVGDVVPYLMAADAFVLTSKVEGMPISIIEALSAGLPCISTNVGGVSDVIHNGDNGILCEENSESISSAMMMLSRNDSLYTAMSGAALQSSKQYSQDCMCESYLRLYRNLLTAKGN